MAQAKPFMEITIQISKSDMDYAAECLLDYLYDEFSEDAIEAVGITPKAFKEELMTFEPFLEMVKNGVVENGMEALETPYDYMYHETVWASKEWRKLYDACEQMEAILDDAKRDESKSTACADAIETLKRAGFKIVKA